MPTEINSILEAFKTMDFVAIIPLIASGGITVWLITQLSRIFNLTKNIITQLISFTILNTHGDDRASCGPTFTNEQMVFNDIISNCTTLWERSLNLDLERKGYGDQNLSTYYNNITYGTSIKILYGKLCLCYRQIRPEAQKIVIETTLRIFFCNKKKFMEKLNNDILNKIDKLEKLRNNDKRVFIDMDESSWVEKEKRKISSIFTKNDIHMDLYNDIKTFIDNKEIYLNVNYPYKYSALLYGVPGSGKTSTILALASELNMDIRYINVATTSTQDFIRYCCNTTKAHKKKIFVFEDIDAAFVDVTSNRLNLTKNKTQKSIENKKNDGMSLSDLLNITDGLLSGDGAICIFTTNHIDKLDPAFIRAGRMNKCVEFKYFDSETTNKMIKHHLNITIDNLKDEIKPTELQDYILKILIGKLTIEDLKHEFCK